MNTDPIDLKLAPSVPAFFSLASESMISFHQEAKEIARIGRDGTVTLSEPGADKVAAQLFWRAMEEQGHELVRRVRELETRLAAYETVEPYVI